MQRSLSTTLRNDAMQKPDSFDDEKNVKEGIVSPGLDHLYRPEIDTSGIDEKKLMRRIDLHIIPWLAVLYLLNFLDRGSIGNARVCITTGFRSLLVDLALNQLYGFEEDLGLKSDGSQYLLALTVFFLPYAVFEVPHQRILLFGLPIIVLLKPASNVLLRKLRPSIWLTTMICLWGIVMVCQPEITPNRSLI